MAEGNHLTAGPQMWVLHRALPLNSVRPWADHFSTSVLQFLHSLK